jgi:hypothetical protein
LERIAPDPGAAARLLEEARRHLESALELRESDRSGAYQLLYDASRKSVASVMAARGLRARPGRQGAHVSVVRFAEIELDAPAVRHFDRMRRTRNRSEYGAITVGAAQLDADLEHARAIVDAAGRLLAS